MITLIHGDDNITSRKHFLSFKTKDSISFDAQDLNLNEFSQVINGLGLFSKSKIILIDNLFTRKGLKNLEDIAIITKSNENLEIYLWADKIVEAKQYKTFKNIDLKLFKIPATIWNFLDSIRPNDQNNILLYHKTLQNTDVEIIFAMLIRQFRLLLGVTTTTKENIDEIKRLAPWQKSKLVRQASFFNKNSLKDIYKKLLDIDRASKTGKSKLNLSQNIDFLLSDI